MSRHLQILPVLRSAAAKIRQPAVGKENAEINTEQKRSKMKLEKPEKNKLFENCGENYLNLKIDVEIGGTCETPKSDKNKIPKGLDCPAAPKKPIRRIGCVSCKRKLMPEFEFFEVGKRKEVNEFFRSSFERISNGKRKISISSFAANTVHVNVCDATHFVSTESSSSSSSNCLK